MEKQVKGADPSLSGKTFLVILGLFVGCALGSGYLVARNKLAIEAFLQRFKTAEPPAPVKEVKTGRIPELKKGKSPLHLGVSLASPRVIFPEADFSLSQTFSATDFCAILKHTLPELDLRWRDSPVIAGATECSGVADAAKNPDGEPHNSLFVQVRRNDKGAASVVRLKLVYLPGKNEPQFKTQFERAAKDLLDNLFPGDVGQILADVGALTPFEIKRQSIDIKLIQEQLFQGSYNLIFETRCGHFDCPTTGRYYRLSQEPDKDTSSADQQE